jgi:hypothetical protein
VIDRAEVGLFTVFSGLSSMIVVRISCGVSSVFSVGDSSQQRWSPEPADTPHVHARTTAESTNMASPYTSDRSSQTAAQGSELADATLKRLTVTFRDVDIQVDGLGEDYSSTCASVLTSMLPSGRGNKSMRVCSSMEHLCHRMDP